MRNLRLLLPLFLTLLPLEGCKVPDIKPFSRATTEMITALSAVFDQARSDLNDAEKLQLDPSQKLQLRTANGAIVGALKVNQNALAAFDKYALVLVELSESGNKGKESITKIADAVQGVANVFGPPFSVVGSTLAQGANAIAGYAQTIRTLNKLEDAMTPADEAIQRAAYLMDANIKDLDSLTFVLGEITNAKFTEANQIPVSVSESFATRSMRADSIANLMIQFDNYALLCRRAKPPRRGVYQKALAQQLIVLAEQDEEVNKALTKAGAAGADSPRTMALVKPPEISVLALINKREAYWLEQGEKGLSPKREAAYNGIRETLAKNDAAVRNHRNALRKSRALLKSWANGHASIKKAVTDEKHTVSFQEVIDGAKALKEFLDKTATNGK